MARHVLTQGEGRLTPHAIAHAFRNTSVAREHPKEAELHEGKSVIVFGIPPFWVFLEIGDPKMVGL